VGAYRKDAARRSQNARTRGPSFTVPRVRDSIGAEVDGHFVCLKGQVVKSSIPRLMVTSSRFICLKCGASDDRHPFKDGVVQPPTRCTTSRCR
jgi:DNA replicative helicase MCM subunit Mcm2 (Cdc46/Mcm family)